MGGGGRLICRDPHDTTCLDHPGPTTYHLPHPTHPAAPTTHVLHRTTRQVAALRAYHYKAQTQPDRKVLAQYGLDLVEGKVRNNVEAGVLEPTLSKVKMIQVGGQGGREGGVGGQGGREGAEVVSGKEGQGKEGQGREGCSWAWAAGRGGGGGCGREGGIQCGQGGRGRDRGELGSTGRGVLGRVRAGRVEGIWQGQQRCGRRGLQGLPPPQFRPVVQHTRLPCKPECPQLPRANTCLCMPISPACQHFPDLHRMVIAAVSPGSMPPCFCSALLLPMLPAISGRYLGLHRPPTVRYRGAFPRSAVRPGAEGRGPRGALGAFLTAACVGQCLNTGRAVCCVPVHNVAPTPVTPI